jgi:predicted secreted protein
MAVALPAFVFGQDPCSQSTQLSATASGAQSWTGKKGATTVGGSGDDAYGVETWTEAGGDATKFTWYGPNQGGGYAFRAEWTNSTDYLGRFGYFWNTNGKKWSALGDLCVDYNYKRSANGTGGSYSYIGVYGWTMAGNNTEAEYYIVEDWFGSGQQNASNLGSNCKTHGNITVDGKTYQVVTCIRPAGSGCVSCGGREFGQVFSIRQGMRNPEPAKCGTISIKKHFEEWTKMTTDNGGQYPAKYIYDKTYESKFLVEAQGGTGNFDATYMKFSRTGSCGLQDGYFSLATSASPTTYGAVTRSPNSTSFASGTKVTLTATAGSGYKFNGWGGDASGSTNPLEVTMNANKAITANFVPANVDTSNALISDGNFPGSSLPSSWTLNQGDGYGNSAASVSVANNKATINVTKLGESGTKVWEPQLVQNGVTLVQGMKYRLSFDASAATARIIGVIIQMAGGDYTDYFTKDTVRLTTQSQTFTYDFTMEKASDENGRIGFNLGQSTGSVTISNVKLNYASSTGIAARRAAPAVKSAANLTLTASGSALSVNFSAKNSGKAAIDLYSLKGDLISSATVQAAAGANLSHTFNTAKLPTGVYVVKVSGNGYAEQAKATVSR